MVHTSDKQHLLDNIETAIIHSLMVESKMQLDLMDVDATWHPNDDLEESDVDRFDHAVSFALIRTYDIISQLSEVAHLKPGICDRTTSITDPVEICGVIGLSTQVA